MNKEQEPWYYQGVTIQETQIPEWAVGFVYRIIRTGDSKDHPKLYIGKKQLTSTRKTKIGKRAIATERASRADGKAKTIKKVIKSSGWQNYWSSCDEIRAGILVHPERFTREILEWCFSKKNMTYNELKYQFRYSVLEKDTFNANINGSLYRHDTDRELYEQFLQRKRDAPKKPRIKRKIL